MKQFKGFLTLSLLSVCLVLSQQTHARIDFQQEIMPILENRCLWCHSVGGHQAGGLFLEPHHAQENLVGIPSTQKEGEIRVIPGSYEESYLIKKLRGDLDIVGARMPPGFYPPLTSDTMNTLRQWIENLPQQIR